MSLYMIFILSDSFPCDYLFPFDLEKMLTLPVCDTVEAHTYRSMISSSSVLQRQVADPGGGKEGLEVLPLRV